MSAAVQNLQIDAFTDYNFQFVWQNPDGSLVNLTGYTGRMQIKDRIGGSVLWDSNTAGGIVLGIAGTPEPTGLITIKIGNSVTGAWGWTTGVYDIVCTSAGGLATRVVQGQVQVNPGVSP